MRDNDAARIIWLDLNGVSNDLAGMRTFLLAREKTEKQQQQAEAELSGCAWGLLLLAAAFIRTTKQ